MSDASPTEPGASQSGAGLEPDSGAAVEAALPVEASGSAAPLTGASKDPAVAREAVTPPRQTTAGRVWVAIGFAVVLLVLLIIFIAENSRQVTISFLGAKGTISLALAMLIAAVVGALITLLVGTTRILQLRREVHRQHKRARATTQIHRPGEETGEKGL